MEFVAADLFEPLVQFGFGVLHVRRVTYSHFGDGNQSIGKRIAKCLNPARPHVEYFVVGYHGGIKALCVWMERDSIS